MTDNYAGEDRRAPDPIQEQIEGLIMQAVDPKDRAMLLILNKIASNLDENTNLTRSLSSDLRKHTDAFAKHEKLELSMFNQGRGFYKAAIAGLALFQMIFAFWIKNHLEENKQTREDLNVVMITVAKHDTMLDNLSKYRSEIPKPEQRK